MKKILAIVAVFLVLLVSAGSTVLFAREKPLVSVLPVLLQHANSKVLLTDVTLDIIDIAASVSKDNLAVQFQPDSQQQQTDSTKLAVENKGTQSVCVKISAVVTDDGREKLLSSLQLDAKVGGKDSGRMVLKDLAKQPMITSFMLGVGEKKVAEFVLSVTAKERSGLSAGKVAVEFMVEGVPATSCAEAQKFS